MNNNDLRGLITKFYNGDSTEEEERYLRAIFINYQVSEEFKTDQELFHFFMKEGRIEEPQTGFEARILNSVDESDLLSVRYKSRKFILTIVSSSAAVLLILLGLYFFFESRSAYKDTYKDPEIAYAETMKILLDVSNRLNKGSNTLKPVSKLSTITELSLEKLQESSSLINKSFKKLNNLGKVQFKKKINEPDVNN